MRWRVGLHLVLVLVLGCDSLSEFRGTFSGSIISGSFVRGCFPEGVRAELRFDPARAVDEGEVLSDTQRNWLTLSTSGEQAQVLFDAPLEPVSLLANDTLADFDFPGPRRLRSYLLFSRPRQGPLAGRDVLIVVSLLASKQVEVRVIARGDETSELCPDQAQGSERDSARFREYYGFFRLK